MRPDPALYESYNGYYDLTLPYYTATRRSGVENYDLTSQIPAVYLLESLARRVHNRLNE